MVPPRRAAIWQNFVRSDYVTSFTDWLMGLFGKLAEVVLYATVLYSSAELYPGVHLPDGLNLAVFIIQMGALDMGGIGLGKLAEQARADGNSAGAQAAKRLSQWLIGIMIASMVTVSLETVVSHLPALVGAQPALQGAQTIVELGQAIARAVCAVLYGKVVHTLKGSHGRKQPFAREAEEQEALATALTELVKRQEQCLAKLASQHELLIHLVGGQDAIADIGYERLGQAITAQLEIPVRELLQHHLAEMRHKESASRVSEVAQSETNQPVSVSERGTSMKQRTRPHDRTVETTILQLLDFDPSYTVRELARRASTSPATAGRLRKAYFETHNQAIETCNEMYLRDTGETGESVS